MQLPSVLIGWTAPEKISWRPEYAWLTEVGCQYIHLPIDASAHAALSSFSPTCPLRHGCVSDLHFSLPQLVWALRQIAAAIRSENWGEAHSRLDALRRFCRNQWPGACDQDLARIETALSARNHAECNLVLESLLASLQLVVVRSTLAQLTHGKRADLVNKAAGPLVALGRALASELINDHRSGMLGRLVSPMCRNVAEILGPATATLLALGIDRVESVHSMLAEAATTIDALAALLDGCEQVRLSAHGEDDSAAVVAELARLAADATRRFRRLLVALDAGEPF